MHSRSQENPSLRRNFLGSQKFEPARQNTDIEPAARYSEQTQLPVQQQFALALLSIYPFYVANTPYISTLITTMPLKDQYISSQEFQYEPLNPSTKEIRLITIESCKDLDKQVQCGMFNRCLEDAGDYIALSYTWGDPNQRRPIWINGRRIGVTRNLEQALRHLRRLPNPGSLPFWIDAACINQVDLNEKTRQVRIMRDIYMGAKTVYAWIGPNTANCEQAFGLVKDMANRWVKDGHKVTKESEEWIKSQTSFLLDSRWLGDLFQRPWWTRAWIVQEIVVSKDPVIVCGDFRLPWNYFFYTCEMFQAYLGCISAESAKGLYAETHPEECDLVFKKFRRLGGGFSRVFYITKSIVERQQNRPAKSFYDAIREHRLTQVTDPLDKIYAFLGLADATHTEVESLPIDYTLSQAELFRTYFQLHLRAHRDLEFFRDCCGPSGPAGFPSWMPHPDAHRFSATPLRFLQYVPKIVYHAATQREATFEIEESGYVLLVEGVYLDDIKITGAVLDLRLSEKLGHVDYNLTNVERSWRALIGLDIVKNGEISPDDKPKLHDVGFYPGRRRILNSLAYLRTICFNPDADLITDFFDPTLGALQTSNMKARDIQQDPLDIDFLKVRLAKTCVNRRFFVTKKGYYGVGPEATSAGDKVCILFGTIAPFVVRPVNHQFVLLGESYLHGFMDGEAIAEMEDGRLKSKRFAFQ
jgi:hypothetical protein